MMLNVQMQPSGKNSIALSRDAIFSLADGGGELEVCHAEIVFDMDSIARANVQVFLRSANIEKVDARLFTTINGKRFELVELKTQ